MQGLESRIFDRRKFIKVGVGTALSLPLFGQVCSPLADLGAEITGQAEPIINVLTNPGARIPLKIYENLSPVHKPWTVNLKYRWLPSSQLKTISLTTNLEGVTRFEVPQNPNTSKLEFYFGLGNRENGQPILPDCAIQENPQIKFSPTYTVDAGFDLVSGVPSSAPQYFECHLNSRENRLKWIRFNSTPFETSFCQGSVIRTYEEVIEATGSGYLSFDEPNIVFTRRDPGILRLVSHSTPQTDPLSFKGVLDLLLQFPSDLSDFQDVSVRKSEINMTLAYDEPQSEGPILSTIAAIVDRWNEDSLTRNNSPRITGLSNQPYLGGYSHSENQPGEKLRWDLKQLEVDSDGKRVNFIDYWINNPGKIYGVYIGASIYGRDQFRAFYSRAISLYRPQLKLTFEVKSESLKRN